MTPKRKLFVSFPFLIAAGVTNRIGQQSLPDVSEVTPNNWAVSVYSASTHLRAEGDAPSSVTVITADEMLKLKVIAEAVENEAQMSFLPTHQCDEIQGRRLTKPLAARGCCEVQPYTLCLQAMGRGKGGAEELP
jgi:hypothetical protein